MAGAYTGHGKTGGGETPRLGVGKPEGLARPGHGNKVSTSGSDSVPKVARPGGPEHVKSRATAGPKVARPGGPESASK